MKGIVLAGGSGSRLWPLTTVVSKQLLPIYDKPMIYYPISTLMLAGVRDFLLITNEKDQSLFKDLLGDGSSLGVKFNYAVQKFPEGLAQGISLAEEFLSGDPFWLILGDNIFHGVGLGSQLSDLIPSFGAQIFTYEVSDPSQYGVLNVDLIGTPISIVEKPSCSDSNLAITGLYYFDNYAVGISKTISRSERGEFEITSVIQEYLNQNSLHVHHLSRGTVWLDTGNVELMQDASMYVRVIEERSGLKIGCLEEISLGNGWISTQELGKLCEGKPKNYYWQYVEKLVQQK